MSRRCVIRSAGVWMSSVAAVLAGCAVGALVGCSHDAPGQIAGEESASDEVVVMQGASEARERSSDAPSPEKGRGAKARAGVTPEHEVAEEGEFTDPLIVTRRFTSEMSRLVKLGKQVAPAELLRQAKRAKSCDVTPLPEPNEKLSPEAVYARARPGVVVVGSIVQPKNHKHFHASLATGFVIRGDGVIVTNYHVLDAFSHAKAVGVMTHDRRVFPVKSVLAADEHNDLAVIKAEAEGLTALPVAASVPVGAAVYCLSHPALDTEESETAFYAFTQGVVCGKFRLCFDGPNPLDVLAITAEYAKGSSGGPILNDRGAVVGVICQTRALFHGEDETEPQLTWKFSRPASSLLALLKGPSSAK